jgi:hypothetical protein
MITFKHCTTHRLYASATPYRLAFHAFFMAFFMLICAQHNVSAQGQTYGMYDVPVTFDASIVGNSFTPKRQYVIHKKVHFVFDVPITVLTPEVGQSTRTLSGDTFFDFTYSTGGKKVITLRKSGSNKDYSFEINIKVPEQGVINYSSPDDIWRVTHTETYAPTPICEAAAYPDRSERPIAGFADAYIKFGAGHNGKLVRPIILVDGVDFDTDKYTDPNKGNQIIRHGSTGWDVLSMGMEDSKPDEAENGIPDYETFRHYPTTFSSLTTSSAANGDDSYDIIFLDFSNGLYSEK